MNWHELQKHKVDQLRQMAKSHGVKGTSGMTKDKLVALVAQERGIAKPHLSVDDSTKAVYKAKIRQMKLKRQEALAGGNHMELKQSRREIHRLKRKIRKAGKLTT